MSATSGAARRVGVAHAAVNGAALLGGHLSLVHRVGTADPRLRRSTA